MATAQSTTPTDQALTEAGFNAWTHPSTGKVRWYANIEPAQIGLELTRYNTGNISSASLDGESVSNGQARDILSAMRSVKVWYDGGAIQTRAQLGPREANRCGWVPERMLQVAERMLADARARS